jgi:Zn-dependent protease with chaperone function
VRVLQKTATNGSAGKGILFVAWGISLMSKQIQLLLFLLLIPVIGYGVSIYVEHYVNSQIQAAVLAEMPDAKPEEVSVFTLGIFCRLIPGELAELCDLYSKLRLIRGASLLVATVSLLWLLVIRLAGKYAAGNRSLLASVFTPLLYLTLFLVIGFTLVQAAIAISSIYIFGSVLFGIVHIGIIISIGIGALIGVRAIAASLWAAVRRAQTLVIGKTLSEENAPLLWQQVRGVAQQLGSLSPDNLVVGLDPTFFVTEADVKAMNETLTGRTLYCSLPLCRVLSKDEVTSIIGHELRHFQGEDTKFSQRFYPIYTGTVASLLSLQSIGLGSDFITTIALRPAFAVLSFFLQCFGGAEGALSRERELVADQAGAEVTSPQTLAGALVKLHAYGDLWQTIYEKTVDAVHENRTLANISDAYVDLVRQHELPNGLVGIIEGHISHPTDSHPSLAVRLEALQVGLAEAASDPIDVDPLDPAINLIPNATQLEEEVSTAYQEYLAMHITVKQSDGEQDEDAEQEQAKPEEAS